MTGFTKSYRQKWQHPVFRDLREAAIWSWMCDTAAWKETTIRYNGELIKLSRGQLATSRRFISQGFAIGEQVTRTFLENLENAQMINQQPTHKATIITICNYNKYQEITPTANPQGNPQPTHSQPTANPNKKEEKKKRKECAPDLAALSLDHVSEWLAVKNKDGHFLDREPLAVLEGFKDYCLSTGKKYKDYPAALRNAFGWERFAGAKLRKPKSSGPALC